KLRRHIQKNLRVEKDETIFKKTLVKFDLKEMVSHFKHIETNFESIYPETIPLTGRVRICLEKIRQSKIKGRKIIDVGCSFGWLEKELENDGFGEILGIDPT